MTSGFDPPLPLPCAVKLAESVASSAHPTVFELPAAMNELRQHLDDRDPGAPAAGAMIDPRSTGREG